MDWVKLCTGYFRDLAIAMTDDASEVMFTRGLAYCGDVESSGFIPLIVLPSLARRPQQANKIADRLTRPTPTGNGPWEKVPGGYQVRNWEVHQAELETLSKRRKSDRDRKRRERDRTRGSGIELSRDRSRDSHAESPHTESKSKNAAAAALDEGPCELSDTVVIFRDKIHGITALQSLRFDLTDSQHARLELLIGVHGDAKLIDEAVRTLRQPSPTKVTAFLRTWEELRAPGDPLMRVIEAKCDEPGHELENVRNCRLCASEVKAGERAGT